MTTKPAPLSQRGKTSGWAPAVPTNPQPKELLMRFRIKKDVTPYGGRAFEGRKEGDSVVLYMDTSAGNHPMQRDERWYHRSEVIQLPDRNPQGLRVGDEVRFTGYGGEVRFMDIQEHGIVERFNRTGYPVILIPMHTHDWKPRTLTDRHGCAVAL